MRSRAKWASAASMRKVRNDWAVLRGRAGIAPPRPAALHDRGFDPARGRAGSAAEMPVVPRCLADGRDGCRFLGCRRSMDARDARGVLGCSRGARRGADRSASRVRACDSSSSSTALTCPQSGWGSARVFTLGSVPVIGQPYRPRRPAQCRADRRLGTEREIGIATGQIPVCPGAIRKTVVLAIGEPFSDTVGAVSSLSSAPQRRRYFRFHGLRPRFRTGTGSPL